MAIRPVFFPALPATATRPGIVTQAFDFLWVPGQAHVQRQKCARSLLSHLGRTAYSSSFGDFLKV